MASAYLAGSLAAHSVRIWACDICGGSTFGILLDQRGDVVVGLLRSCRASPPGGTRGSGGRPCTCRPDCRIRRRSATLSMILAMSCVDAASASSVPKSAEALGKPDHRVGQLGLWREVLAFGEVDHDLRFQVDEGLRIGGRMGRRIALARRPACATAASRLAKFMIDVLTGTSSGPISSSFIADGRGALHVAQLHVGLHGAVEDPQRGGVDRRFRGRVGQDVFDQRLVVAHWPSWRRCPRRTSPPARPSAPRSSLGIGVPGERALSSRSTAFLRILHRLLCDRRPSGPASPCRAGPCRARTPRLSWPCGICASASSPGSSAPRDTCGTQD